MTAGIVIALAGNPNAGKTTLFNTLTGSRQYVGNRPGVTVDIKKSKLKYRDNVTVVDLPGTYSLSPYTQEEVITKDYLTGCQRPDVILNIVDGTNLGRNLYLTTQLIELGLPVVVAVNMMDIMEKKQNRIDTTRLAKLLGCPVAEVSALKERGVKEAVNAALKAAGNKKLIPHSAFPGSDEERHGHIERIVRECVEIKSGGGLSISDKIDRIVTNRFLALPIFAAVMFMVYFVSVSAAGALLTDWTNDVLFGRIIPGAADKLLLSAGSPEWLRGLIADGIIAGVGAVLGFVPQLLMLFMFLAFLEGCGYMARIAFILDRFFRRFGLSGKSFIPILIGTGCGVPGIMACRTIENKCDRRMTVITTTFIPCAAKLPVIALIAGAFFGDNAWWLVPFAYLLGVFAIITSGVILKRTRLFAGGTAPFIMELPSYQFPPFTKILRTMWDNGWEFIKKAGTVVLLASIAVWFMSGFGFEAQTKTFGMVDARDSLLAGFGSLISWIFAPIGWGHWEASVAAISGLIAKENIVGTFGVLYGHEGISQGFSPLSALSFLVFNLLCAPCIAAVGAIRSEMKSVKWFWFALLYQCGFAYIAALIIYQTGSLLITFNIV